jgi:hypothetical protein
MVIKKKYKACTYSLKSERRTQKLRDKKQGNQNRTGH